MFAEGTSNFSIDSTPHRYVSFTDFGILTYVYEREVIHMTNFPQYCLSGLLPSFFKHAAKTMPFFLHCSNLSSDSTSFVNVIKAEGYGIVEMNRKPVNSLSLEMLTELANVIETLEADPSCQGMILTSVSIWFLISRVFSKSINRFVLMLVQFVCLWRNIPTLRSYI